MEYELSYTKCQLIQGVLHGYQIRLYYSENGEEKKGNLVGYHDNEFVSFG